MAGRKKVPEMVTVQLIPEFAQRVVPIVRAARETQCCTHLRSCPGQLADPGRDALALLEDAIRVALVEFIRG